MFDSLKVIETMNKAKRIYSTIEESDVAQSIKDDAENAIGNVDYLLGRIEEILGFKTFGEDDYGNMEYFAGLLAENMDCLTVSCPK